MCKSGKQIILCSCKGEEQPVVPHKKSKRWQKKNPPSFAYIWTLSQFVEYFDSMMEGLMCMPDNCLDENLNSDFVLQELNSHNCFDFDCVPKEGDNLKIRRNDAGKYFSYIFRAGKWEANSYDVFCTKTELIDSGKLTIHYP